jgi:micrococcal nuclease
MVGLLLALLGLAAVVFGAINVVYPIGRLGVSSRKMAAGIIVAGVASFVAGGNLLPDQATPDPAASGIAAGRVSEASRDKASEQNKPGAAGVETAQNTPPAPVSAPAAPASDIQSTITTSATAVNGIPVISVVDGDTIKVKIGSKEETVRVIGADTPETVHPSQPVEPYGLEASAYTKKRLTGQQVRLELDVEERDRYGRLLAYVWLGDELVNATLIKEGYAQVLTIPPNVKYADRFVALQREAWENQRGLWGLPVPGQPAGQPQQPAEAKRGSFAPDGQGSCVEGGVEYIKGNRDNMIYHSPRGQFYSRTKAEACFYTAADAEAAGFRASQR